MKKIAITGGVATGKTTLLHLIKELGFPIFSCDEVVKSLYLQPEITRKIFGLFKTLDKKEILKKILENEKTRKALEEILHPLVKEELVKFSKTCEQKGEKAVFVEVPLLFECGWEDMFDEVWVVFCSKKTQEDRIRTKSSYPDLMLKLANLQLPLEEKAKKANRVFSSEKPIEVLREEIKAILKEFQ
ncbi:dephospho-CoA kinase [Thermodesulfobacterium sp. TA1]|uniref:dephospho-CoA kinase n=1 Tax=Thermodesulfobacterium sp. TA1 TaxID=2234087 RepID=UPI0012322F44|nr:dephospho-CoA kinase [Thermodesulfobacterium sp. TA1]QER41389.1 dephospho-CoA kinase [Thermodesulfobacterium sp. TA1]